MSYREPFGVVMDVLDECGAVGDQRTRVVRAIGRIAQLAEQRAFNPQREGSTPSPSIPRLTPDEAAALVDMIRRA